MPEQPINTGPLLQQALDHHRRGQFGEAEVIYRSVINLEPNNADALHLLGVLAAQAGHPQDGLALLDRAVAIAPESAGFHANRGNILRQLGRLDDALVAYQQSARLDPANPLPQNNMGDVLRDLDRREEALGAHRAALSIRPDFAAAHSSLGNVLRELGRFDDALAASREAVRLEPNNAGFQSNLGIALSELKLYEEAIAAYERAIALAPRMAGAYINLGHVYLETGRLADSITAAFAGADLAHDIPEAHINLGNALIAQGRVEEAVEAYQNALKGDPSLHQTYTNMLLALHNRVHAPQWMFEQHRQWGKLHTDPLAGEIRPHHNSREPERRLRIGILSPDLRDHAVGRLVLPVFERHDRERYEFVAFTSIAAEDDETAKFRAAADEWHSTLNLNEAAIASLIRAHRIDILIELSGHTSGNALLALARKPAPIQITWIGYADTTGMSAVDYRVTDAIADPPGASDGLHTEKLIRLDPCFLCVRLMEGNIAAVGADRRFTFASFNNFTKVSPQTAAMWARILRSVPGARLLLRSRGLTDPQTADFVREALTAEGVPVERVDLLSHEAKGHLDRYNEVDVALDTFPYSGTATTIDALSMGVPVITLGGETHASRVSSSLLGAAGLTDNIANDEDAYVDLAIAAAAKGNRTVEQRRALREQIAHSPLCDEVAFTRRLEKALRKIWVTWCTNP